VQNDGPSDAAVVRPNLNSRRGVVIGCGMNPNYGDLDPYHMATSSIDEAIRNCVAVGADPRRIAILDNFCWGYTDRPETLGTLVRAALACYDLATVLQTPFISGKDSLNNEFSFVQDGAAKTISIPSTLLISAMGQIADVASCVTMDLKRPGNLLYLIGKTKDELGGSHLDLVLNRIGTDSHGNVPTVDPANSRHLFTAVHAAIVGGLIRACHDLSEGGLAVALAEMAFAGGCGVRANLDSIPFDFHADNPSNLDSDIGKLFSESNTRFICEVEPKNQSAFAELFDKADCQLIGDVTGDRDFKIRSGQNELLSVAIDELKQAWQSPLDWA
jgi:phosphoribosylformylglycinamidine synthase